MRNKTPEKPAAPVTDAEFVHDFVFLRTAQADCTSHNGFQWPTVAGEIVTAPDWDPKPECGNGLDGLAHGMGDWGLLKSPADPLALWYVCGALRSEVVDLGGKIKVPRCRVLYVGQLAGALELISPAMSTEILRLVEERGKAAKKVKGSKTSAEAMAASATGEHCVALAAGFESRGRVGKGCLLVLVERDGETEKIVGHFTALAGEKGVAPDTWYTLRKGKLHKLTAKELEA